MFFLLTLLIIGCKKNGEGEEDYGAAAAGMYTGYFMYSGTSIDGTTKITRESNTTIKMDCNTVDTTIAVFSGVVLSDAGNGNLHLQFDRTSPTVDGTVSNKALTYTIHSAIPVSFTGNKPK